MIRGLFGLPFMFIGGAFLSLAKISTYFGMIILYGYNFANRAMDFVEDHDE